MIKDIRKIKCDMRPIPQKLRNELEQSGINAGCALDTGDHGHCEGTIQWHHVWIYAGRQINEFWAIVGGCKKHHAEVDTKPKVRNAFKIASLRRATTEDLKKYKHGEWDQIKKRIGYTEEHVEESPF